MSEQQHETKKCLVTGATGYIGGRLVPYLLRAGHEVRVTVRDSTRLNGRQWEDDVEIIEADVLDPRTLDDVLKDIDVAYYLVHSMSGTGSDSFHEKDLNAARNFGRKAEEHDVDRIIYLGGLGNDSEELSEHLKSRHLVGEVLREFAPDVTEFRAAIVVGSGSKSFEMIRYLTERVPLMICPQWVFSKVQPIAIRTVLNYLTKAATRDEARNEIIEIGGRSVLEYADMMEIYADLKGLTRMIIPVPVLTPKLSSYWVHWMTPIPAALARPLIEGLKNDVIVNDEKAKKMFPDVEPMRYREAVRRAIERVDTKEVETTWNDALISSKTDKPVELETKQGMNIERRQRWVDVSQEKVFRAFNTLGGEKGYLTFNWAWKLRGILDRMVGGVGFRRGRRDPEELRVGDALDFWRVEAVKPHRLLRLRAEMKVPGKAWLEFQAIPSDKDKTKLVQTAYFAPKGLFGLLYWYALYPLHGWIFSSLVQKVADEAQKL